MKKEITLTMEELKKYDLVQKAIEGSVITEGLMMLGLSERDKGRDPSGFERKAKTKKQNKLEAYLSEKFQP